MTSMFDRDDVGPAINADHIVAVVSGTRHDVPEGWFKRYEEWTRTDYGMRKDVVYEYPDGTEIRR